MTVTYSEPFSDTYVVHDQLMVNLGGALVLTAALLFATVIVFVARNIAPRLRERRRKELFRIAYLNGQRDNRVAREVIEEENARAFDDQFRNITDPMKRDFKRKPRDET